MKPNLIYVFADQLRHAALGYNGEPHRLTPNLDALRRQSLCLDNAVSGHPVCAPYRASLFTGKYTTSTGMVINEIRLRPDHRCIAHVLNEAGYENAYIGKWHLYANQLGNHLDPKNSFVPKGPDRLGFDGYFAHYGFHHEYYGESAYYHLDTNEKIFHKGYEPDCQVDMAIEQLSRLSAEDKPFSLFLSLGTPHDPWVPENVPAEYLERVKDMDFPLPPNYLPENDPYADNWAKLKPEERAQLPEWMRCYHAMVANLDDNIGRLLRAVDELGLADNSILVFTSDHGELFGAHGRRAKNIFYEEAVRVPFLMRWNGKLEANGSCDACFNTVDIMPTLLNLMGLPAPESAEGSDQSQYLLSGNKTTDDGSLMMCTGPTAAWGDGHEWRAYRTKRYTYAVYKKDGRDLLFDHAEDPHQMRDLAGEAAYAKVLEDLRERMRAKMARINDTFEHTGYYRDHWVDENRIIRQTATQARLATETE
ncbi:MAG TPA: sulfatase [Clostridia bacterium]|nr:sulfatase [Clostridia bacterium]